MRKVLASMMVVCLSAPLVLAEAFFTDLPEDHWGYAYSQYLVEQGIMEVGNGNKFRPNDPATRAEVVKVIVLAADIPFSQSKNSSFADVPAYSRYFPYIQTAQERGIVRGYEDGDFRPNDQVTRAEFLKVLMTAFVQEIPEAEGDPSFIDVPAEHWALGFVEVASEMGLVQGYPDGNFRPNDPVTLVQSAKIVYLIMAHRQMITDDITARSSDPQQEEEQLTEAEVNNYYEQMVLGLINALRAEEGQMPLELDPVISAVARSHARYLADEGLKSESIGEDDLTPFDRLKEAGVKYVFAAENVAWASANARTVAETLIAIHTDSDAGMMSQSDSEPSHRTNILGTFNNFTKIGIGVIVTNKNNQREVRVVENFVQVEQ